MILIAIGANLPGLCGSLPLETCRAAAQRVREDPGLDFVALSSWYRTAAIPRGDFPDYCNGVLRLRGEADPAELLARMHAIEAEFGRERGELNAPRTLDLDVIDINGLIRATPTPVLPHPRAHLRAFVLRPILDVAPGWRHPVLRQNVATLLSELPPQGIQPWHDEAF
ncbi:MAG TPA: 2-amino-4-hydroxy-6-hydroxymethyldihydropteridine diphosphokinase [Acidocella sp.]|nr:MAG: 2-amino-4-hydroxy-6-hydroxymethyldihydropteridine diphosphokinase [Acidocella sp. 20-61-6]HQT47779.1 2-amino-4-hydroxy-6-hydroxymethyldihydropteridine diphosphokinase [Acidocella sp.]